MKTKRKLTFFASFSVAFLVLIAFSGSLWAALNRWPSLGAQGADLLRAFLGDHAVSHLEMAYFKFQDTLQEWQCRLGLSSPEAPWQMPAPDPTQIATPVPVGAPKATPTPPDSAPMETPGITATPSPPFSPPSITEMPAATSTPTLWTPQNLAPLGKLKGEGLWSAYIQDPQGKALAYRTFLQPDPQRPYAFVAIVAFDLTATRLHYVLGSIEPLSPDGPRQAGKIAAEDRAPGRLLATFNGGFKATHGQFGAMADGILALPPKDGLGAVIIYADGRVELDECGAQTLASPEVLAWRQNGPLVVQGGRINPRIYNNSPKDWGYTVDDVSPTLRSGLALNADGKTLYYLAGPRLTMEALALSMLSAGAANGIQLDINNYWVHFVAIRQGEDGFAPEALLPEFMTENLDRYLYPYTRDFFYITAGF